MSPRQRADPGSEFLLSSDVLLTCGILHPPTKKNQVRSDTETAIQSDRQMDFSLAGLFPSGMLIIAFN